MTRKMPKVDSPVACASEDGFELSNGRKLAAEAHAWMENHEHEFMEIYRFVKQLQADETKGRLRDRVAVFCVESGLSVEGSGHFFDNSLWAGVCRYMALYDKSLLGAQIRLRRSDIDCFGIYTVSWMEADANGDAIE